MEDITRSNRSGPLIIFQFFENIFVVGNLTLNMLQKGAIYLLHFTVVTGTLIWRKKENMIDIKHKRCSYENCLKRPTFNLPTEKIAIYCSEHKKENTH